MQPTPGGFRMLDRAATPTSFAGDPTAVEEAPGADLRVEDLTAEPTQDQGNPADVGPEEASEGPSRPGIRERLRPWVARLSRLLGWDGVPGVDIGNEKAKGLTQEAYRAVAHRLTLLPDSGTRVVLVVNAVHGEGSSTVTRHLASALAQGQENRVLLVDGNLPIATNKKATSGRPVIGLAELTAGRTNGAGANVVDSGAGFALQPRSDGDRMPLQVPSPVLLQEAFGKLRNHFDWILVDGPPVTVSTEAAALSAVADATVLVLRAESTRSEVADRAARIIHQSGGNLVGAVLNQRRFHIPSFLYRHL